MLRPIFLLCLSSVVFAKNISDNFKQLAEAETVTDAIKSGQTALDFRFRIENVNVDNKPDGHANTLKSMISYETGRFKDVAAIMEFSSTASYLGTKHNAGVTTPNFSARPEILDPRAAALTRGAFGFFGMEETKVILGRQTIKLDNERLVGNDDFRQMQQTFDAITITNESFPGMEAFYGFLSHVNTVEHGSLRSVGQRQIASHLFNFSWLGFPAGDFTMYGYLLSDKDAPKNSNDTYGVRFKGDIEVTTASLLYEFEYARQRGRHNNPMKYTSNYYLLQAGIKAENVTFNLGFDRQMGDAAIAGRAFQTPLSSKDFNGYAEQFVTTPDRGLDDLYAKVNADIFGIVGYLAYHRFKAQAGPSQRYGHEYDISIFKSWNEHVTFGLEFAQFWGTPGSGFVDTRKLWLTAEAKF